MINAKFDKISFTANVDSCPLAYRNNLNFADVLPKFTSAVIVEQKKSNQFVAATKSDILVNADNLEEKLQILQS